jgi:hypothetical protein
MDLFKKNKNQPSSSQDSYVGFPYQPRQLVRFLQTGYTFTLLLQNDSIVHFEPENTKAFSEWLIAHHIPNILFID